MSFDYDLYLIKHRCNVAKGYNWLKRYLPEIIDNMYEPNCKFEVSHDLSKDEPDEYNAYDTYFYGDDTSDEVSRNFQKAWFLHIHRNPHHWQYWVLINDEPDEGIVAVEMTYDYIVEMICDWWAFSWSNGDLNEIFNWYDEHSNYIILADKTRETVEDILYKMRCKLIGLEIEHSGIKGMKWGIKNGPPYPLNSEKNVEKTDKHSKIKTTKIANEKFTEYALNFDKAPDKAKAFKDALGYTKDNYKDLIDNINKHFDIDKLEERGDSGYGMRYQQVMKLKGPNGKEANVLTAWIEEGENIKLTSVYVTKKEESK